MNTFARCLFWVGVSFLAAIIGGIGTAVGLGPWYQALNKPSWNPPSWIFGPVWSTLYTLMGISMGLMDSATLKSMKPGVNHKLRTIFVVQITLNAVWPILFFGAGLLWLGLAEIIVLEIFILAWIRLGWSEHRPASFLIMPYAVWVGFATCLNANLAWLN